MNFEFRLLKIRNKNREARRLLQNYISFSHLTIASFGGIIFRENVIWGARRLKPVSYEGGAEK